MVTSVGYAGHLPVCLCSPAFNSETLAVGGIVLWLNIGIKGLNINCMYSLVTSLSIIANILSCFESFVALHINCAVMNEDIAFAIVGENQTKPLSITKPFYSTFIRYNL